MGNQLVKYRNDLNAVPFRKFNRKDFNIFFAIISRMRDQGTKDVTFKYSYLMKLSGLHYGNRISRFTRDLERTYDKMLHLTLYRNDEHRFVSWVIFTEFDIDKDNKTCTISVNPKLVGVLNKLAHWTRFSLAQFTQLRSSYAKTMFRLIKQYRTIGHLYLGMDKFKRLLCVPKSYTNEAITRRVINPIKVELTPIVRGLHVIKVKRGQGGKIVGYKFTFSMEAHDADDFSKGWKQDIQRMNDYVTGNPYLEWDLKKKSLDRISKLSGKQTVKHRRRSKGHEPMGAFNRILSDADLSTLEMYLKMYKHKSPTVHFSEYQSRKLRKTIAKRKKDADENAED